MEVQNKFNSVQNHKHTSGKLEALPKALLCICSDLVLRIENIQSNRENEEENET